MSFLWRKKSPARKAGGLYESKIVRASGFRRGLPSRELRDGKAIGTSYNFSEGRDLFWIRGDIIMGGAMKRKNIAVLVLFTFAGLAAVGSSHRFALVPKVSAAVPAAVPVDANQPVIRFVKNPEMAPPIQAMDLLGKPVNKDNWTGKVVLVNFWATWCPPCREEIPELLELKKEFKDKMEIVGISEDDDPPASVIKFARAKGMTYPIVMATPELIDAYGGVPALPTSFLIDTQGRVVQKHSGLYPIEVYELEIRSLSGNADGCARRDICRYGPDILEKCGKRDRIAGRKFQGADSRAEETRVAAAEFRKLHVRMQLDAFAMPRERYGVSVQREVGGAGREGSCNGAKPPKPPAPTPPSTKGTNNTITAKVLSSTGFSLWILALRAKFHRQPGNRVKSLCHSEVQT